MSSIRLGIVLMGFKNLGRHKVKTVITALAITIGVSLYIVMDAWLLGMNIDSKRNLVNFETGSARIYSKEYFDKKDELPLYAGFNNYEPVLEQLDNAGYNAAPRTVFVGSLISDDNELPFKFIGVDPVLEKTVFHYYEHLEEGSTWLENGDYSILMGVKGAQDLGVNIGDSVRLTTIIDMKDEKGRIRHVHQLINLTIRGLVNSPNPMTNGTVAYMPLDILQGTGGLLLEGMITDISIRKKGASQTELPTRAEQPDRIQQLMDGPLREDLVLVDWREDAKDFLAVLTGDVVSTNIMVAVLFILSVIGISNTMLMAVFERTKEIGMLRSLGMKDRNIVQTFLVEAGLIGLIGSAIGIILGSIGTWLLVKYGVDYTSMLEETSMDNIGYRINGIFKAAWNYRTIAITWVIATFIAAASAFFPARKAVKMSIVDTLRFE
jgi:putative ABC transport system permease protein